MSPLGPLLLQMLPAKHPLALDPSRNYNPVPSQPLSFHAVYAIISRSFNRITEGYANRVE